MWSKPVKKKFIQQLLVISNSESEKPSMYNRKNNYRLLNILELAFKK